MMTDVTRVTPRTTRLLTVLLLVTVATVPACAEKPAAPAKTEAEAPAKTEAEAPAKTETAAPAATEAATEAQAANTLESTDILAREPSAETEVKHVLIGWADLAAAYGGRMPDAAKTRSKADADKLATDVLARARGGEDFVALMKQYSEDWGSAATGQSYPVTPTAGLVPPFKNLSLRLNVDESGLVLTNYGWHIIKRVK